MKFTRLFVERSGLMLDVASRQKFSRRDGFDGPANQNSIHHDFVSDGEVSGRELMFGRNILGEGVELTVKFDSSAGFQVGKGDQDVVPGIELEHAGMHRNFPAIVKHRSGGAF
jgi:hypothetical protein